MDWRSIKYDWNRVRAFLVTAEEGSLSAAAQALGVSQPTLGRQVSALEAELGLALFERVGRGLELTPGGLELLEHARSMADAATQLSLVATGQSDSLEGDICISASEAMATFMLPPILHRLRLEQPRIHVTLLATNDPSDLRRREADIAVRSFRPTQPDLIARRVTEFKANLYATPEYLALLGNPNSTADFSGADFLGFNDNHELMKGLNEWGFQLTPENFPVMTENHITQWELVKQGLGIGVMMQQVGDAEPRVQRILQNYEPMSGEIWLVAHRELRTSRRVRMVFDFLAQALSQAKV
jgi:DNA-binding transcriptional LysR family regulator